MWAATVDGGRWSAWPAWRCRYSTTSTSPRRSSSCTPTTAAAGSGPRCSRRSSTAAARSGRTVLMASPYSPVDRPGAGEELLTAHGFELGDRRDVSGSATSRSPSRPGPRWRPRPRPQHAGYRLEAWQDADARAARRGLLPPRRGVQRRGPAGRPRPRARRSGRPSGSRKRDARFLATGRRQFGVLAYAPDGTCVATTELFVNEVASWRALQGGTLVLPGPPRPPARAGPQAGQPAGRPRALPRLPLRLHRRRRRQRRR